MMPALALVGFHRLRWLPLPIPLVLLWPFAGICLGIARLLDRERPADAEKLRTAVQVFRDLRGLTIDVDTAEARLRIRFL